MKFNHEETNTLAACGFTKGSLAASLEATAHRLVKNGITDDNILSDSERLAIATFICTSQHPYVISTLLNSITGKQLNTASETVELIYTTLKDDELINIFMALSTS